MVNSIYFNVYCTTNDKELRLLLNLMIEQPMPNCKVFWPRKVLSEIFKLLLELSTHIARTSKCQLWRFFSLEKNFIYFSRYLKKAIFHPHQSHHISTLRRFCLPFIMSLDQDSIQARTLIKSGFNSRQVSIREFMVFIEKFPVSIKKKWEFLFEEFPITYQKSIPTST